MYCYILCFCGRSIGDLYDLFCAMRAAVYEANKQTVNPAKAPITDQVAVDISTVLDDLGLHMQCCRVRISTQVEMKEVY